MAKISFNEISMNEGSSDRIEFFGLKNNGDEAIVRIMHDSTDTFDIVTTHPVSIDGRYRRVNCIRNPRDPIENCPLCSNGSKIQQRIYIHLIHYINDENGNIVPRGKVWERSASFAVTLKNLIDEYGPLSRNVFKIRRNGEAGDMKTTYSIMYANPQNYNEQNYPIIPNIFDNYSAVGNAVLDKSFKDLNYFINTGKFEDSNANINVDNSITSNNFNNSITSDTGNVNNSVTAQYTQPNQVLTYNKEQSNYINYSSPSIRDTHINPNSINSNEIQRPVRYY